MEFRQGSPVIQLAVARTAGTRDSRRLREHVRIGGDGGALLTNVVIELFRDLVLRARDQTGGLVVADGVGVALRLDPNCRLPSSRSPYGSLLVLLVPD